MTVLVRMATFGPALELGVEQIAQPCEDPTRCYRRVIARPATDHRVEVINEGRLRHRLVAVDDRRELGVMSLLRFLAGPDEGLEAEPHCRVASISASCRV